MVRGEVSAERRAATLDFSASDFAKGLSLVHSDASPENFCVFGYLGSSKIVLKSTGTTGLEGLVDCLRDDEISFALVRVETSSDTFTSSFQFLFVTWVGPKVDGLARGRVGPHKIELKKLIGWTVLDLQTDDRDELKGNNIRSQLQKASFKSMKLFATRVAEPQPGPKEFFGECECEVGFSSSMQRI